MMRPVAVLVGLLVAASGCGNGSDERSSSELTTSAAPTTTAGPATAPGPPDDVCDELAGPVDVLNGTVGALAGPDLEQVSSQDAWGRMITQYEANAAAMTQIGAVVPQLSDAAHEAAAQFAERAAAGRATEPDLALIDRARQASRSQVDPVAVVTGLEPIMASDGPAAEVAGYVSRTCPELDPDR